MSEEIESTPERRRERFVMSPENTQLVDVDGKAISWTPENLAKVRAARKAEAAKQPDKK
jgi:hypothetical protein